MTPNPECKTTTIIGESGTVYENIRIPDEHAPHGYHDHLLTPAEEPEPSYGGTSQEES